MRRTTRSTAAAAVSASSPSSARATSKQKKRSSAATEASKAPDAAAPSSPKRAKAAASAEASVDVWGALFAAPKRTISLRPASPLSAELQARVDAAALAFSGVEKRRSDGVTRIAAWNVNGLRALLRNDDSVHLRAYVAREDPDVLCLSETKVDRDELQKVGVRILCEGGCGGFSMERKWLTNGLVWFGLVCFDRAAGEPLAAVRAPVLGMCDEERVRWHCDLEPGKAAERARRDRSERQVTRQRRPLPRARVQYVLARAHLRTNVAGACSVQLPVF